MSLENIIANEKLEKLVNDCKIKEAIFLEKYNYNSFDLYKSKEACIESYGTSNTDSLIKVYESYFSILEAGLEELKKK